MSITTSNFVGGIDAVLEIERQINLVLNNLFHILPESTSGAVAWGDDYKKTITVLNPHESFWIVECKPEGERVATVSFWFRYENGSYLEYLRWTKETKYLWMRTARRPKVVQICHSALDGLISGVCDWVPELHEELAYYSNLYVYASNLKKSSVYPW